MELIEEILQTNEKFCANPPKNYEGEDYHASKLPKKKLAIVTCMDTRLVDFLEPALGLTRGDVKVIKTAGNCITGVFDSTVKSLLVCIYELGVKEIAVIGHHECGIAKTTSESLTKAMIESGVVPGAIQMIEKELKEWADEFGTNAQKAYFADKECMYKVLTLCMGIGGKKRRKDFICAKQAVETVSYFFDESFAPEYEYRFDNAVVKTVLEGFKAVYSAADDNSAWFEKVKMVAADNGFATDMKAYKADPDAYPGNVSDVAEMLRIATTGLSNTPDLWTIMQIIGKDETIARLEKAIAAL